MGRVAEKGAQLLKQSDSKIRTHHHITKARQGRKGLLNPFSPECGSFFSLEKVGEFRLNPGSRTKFANLPNFAMRWWVHSLDSEPMIPQ